MEEKRADKQIVVEYDLFRAVEIEAAHLGVTIKALAAEALRRELARLEIEAKLAK